MNRILLVPLVTAALLAAGCNSSRCDATDLTFYWRFVGAPVSGQARVAGDFTAANNGCAAAGIDAQGIDVFIGGERFQFDCGDQSGNVGIPGVTFAGTVRGTYDWRIDAYRGGQLAFTQSGTADARACGPVGVDADLQAVTPQPMVVYYDVNGRPPTNCAVSGIPIANVVFELRNAANQVVDSTCIAPRDPATGICPQEGTNACDVASLGFVTTPLDLGVYTMQYLELYSPGNTAVPLAASCGVGSAPSIVHDGLPVVVNTTAPVASACGTGPATPLLASGTSTP